MKLIMITDCHQKNEEPFFRAGVALNNYVLELLKKETEPFIFIDGGDRFHNSKETGRLNGEVVRFFLAVAELENCESIYVMQGNHDIKEETGSALDVIKDIHDKITIVKKPMLCEVNEATANKKAEFMYLLPYMKPHSLFGFTSINCYGNENFHKGYYTYWDTAKDDIKMVSFHGGDETTGKLFMNADISFLPGIRSNGHIHKQMSKNHLTSAMVTRRDEIDKKCHIRYIDTETWEIEDKEIPLFLNYASISYGEDIDDYFKSGVHIKPEESLVVDIYGHDDKDLVVEEYMEKWKNKTNPILYIGEVTPAERKGEAVLVEERDSLDISSVNIRELLKEFCEEKKIEKVVVDDLMTRVA